MKLSNKAYDFWKWFDLTCLPALLTLYGVIGQTCNIPYTDIVLTIGAGVVACIGSLLGISNYNYNKEEE